MWLRENEDERSCAIAHTDTWSWATDTQSPKSVRAWNIFACVVHCTTQMNEKENVLPTSRISVCVGLIPSVPGHELAGCQVSKQQQLLFESFTPRRLQLDRHDVVCERAHRVEAQHVHSSFTSGTFARVHFDRGDGDLQSLWPASYDMSQFIYCCFIAVTACGIGLFHMARASSRLTSVPVNIILGTHTLCVSACLPPRRALTCA